jgi:glutathione S-transferase
MALTVCGWPPPARARRKVDGLVQRHPLSRPSPGVNGPGETPPEQRDPAAIAAGIAPEALFAMLDDELAKMPWLSGEQFGLGDIAVAPFVYNLLSILDNGNRGPICALVSAD